MLHFSWSNGQMLHKKKFKSLEKGLAISFCHQEHQSTSGSFITTNDDYELDSELPKIVMSGETSDISQLCE